jgi:predicted dehydrogenase
MRTAVIGVGIAGWSHLFDLVSSSDFDVVAVCASRAETAREAAGLFGIPAAHCDVSELLAVHAPDAVVIATPPHVTPGILARCLAAGAWVISDKPAAPGGQALREVIEDAGMLADRARVAYNRRYQGHVSRARDLIAEGALGTLTEVICRWTGPFAQRYTSPSTYRALAGPGEAVLIDTACHVIDTLAILGLGAMAVDEARVTALPSRAETGAEMHLTHEDLRLPVVVSIRDHGEDDEWRVIVRGRTGILELDRHALRGECDGLPIRQAASDVRPVDDFLLLGSGQRAHGATLEEAALTLDTIDRIRAVAGWGKREWMRPRAKALGRLNGAC